MSKGICLQFDPNELQLHGFSLGPEKPEIGVGSKLLLRVVVTGVQRVEAHEMIPGEEEFWVFILKPSGELDEEGYIVGSMRKGEG